MEQAKRKKLEQLQPQKAAAFNISQFDLTNSPLVDISILNEEYEEIIPHTKTSDVIEIHYNGSPSHWINLRETSLYLNLGVRTKVDARLPNSSKTSIGNYILATLFETIDIKINGVQITSGGNLSGYSAYMNKSLFNSTETLLKKGPLEGFYINTHSSTFSTDNKAYVSLKTNAQADTIELIGRIPNALFETTKFLPPSTSLTNTHCPKLIRVKFARAC